jgi:hypothetical protein
MQHEFRTLEAAFPKILGNSLLTRKQIRDLESVVSDALANISNTSPADGVQFLDSFVKRLEESGPKEVNQAKFLRFKEMVQKYRQDFFDEFWVNQFFKGEEIAPDGDEPETPKKHTGQVESILNSEADNDEEVLSTSFFIPEELNQSVKEFLLKLSHLNDYRKARAKSVIADWKKQAAARAKQVRKKSDRIFECFGKIFINKYKAYQIFNDNVRELGNVPIEGDYERKRSVIPFRESIRRKTEAIDRLKAELEGLDAENMRLSRLGIEFDDFDENAEEKAAQKRTEAERRAAEVEQFLKDREKERAEEEGVKDASGDDNWEKLMMDTGEIFKKRDGKAADTKRKTVSFDDEIQVRSGSPEMARSKFDRRPMEDPFDVRVTQILPDPTLATQRLEPNISLSLIQLDGFESIPKRHEKDEKDSEQSKKDKDRLVGDFMSGPQAQSAEALVEKEHESERSEDLPSKKEDQKPLSILRRFRFFNRMFLRMRKDRLWAGFCRLTTKCQRSKLALTQTSDRMMAKLILSTRQNMCGFDVRKKLRQWFVRSNPQFAKACLLKFLSRLPIRIPYVVFRMKQLLMEKGPKRSGIQRLLRNNTGLDKLASIVEGRAYDNQHAGFKALKIEHSHRNSALDKIFQKLRANWQENARTGLKKLKNLGHLSSKLLAKLGERSKFKASDALKLMRRNSVVLGSLQRASSLSKLQTLEAKLKADGLRIGWQTMRDNKQKRLGVDRLKAAVVKRIVYMKYIMQLAALKTLVAFSRSQRQSSQKKMAARLYSLANRFRANVKNDKSIALARLVEASRLSQFAEQKAQEALNSKKIETIQRLKAHQTFKAASAISSLKTNSNDNKLLDVTNKKVARKIFDRLQVIAKSKLKDGFSKMVHNFTHKHRNLTFGIKLLCQVTQARQSRNLAYSFGQLSNFALTQRHCRQVQDIFATNRLKLMSILLKMKSAQALSYITQEKLKSVAPRVAAATVLLVTAMSNRFGKLHRAFNRLQLHSCSIADRKRACVNRIVNSLRTKLFTSHILLVVKTRQARNTEKLKKTSARNIEAILRRPPMRIYQSLIMKLIENLWAHKAKFQADSNFKLQVAGRLATMIRSKVNRTLEALKANGKIESLQQRQKDLQQNFLRQQTLAKQRGGLNVYFSAQNSKIKSAFRLLVGNTRSMENQKAISASRRHKVAHRLGSMVGLWRAEAFQKLRDFSDEGKKGAVEAVAHREQAVMSVFGEPNTTGFGMIPPTLLSDLSAHVRARQERVRDASAKHLEAFLTRNNVDGIYVPLIEVCQYSNGECLHELALKLIPKMDSMAVFSQPKWAPFKAAVLSLVTEGRIKNNGVSQWYSAASCVDPDLNSPSMEGIKTSDRAGDFELSDCIRHINQESFPPGAKEILLDRLIGERLTDKIYRAAETSQQKINLAGLTGQQKPKISDICAALKVPSHREKLEPIQKIIDSSQIRHFDRISILISTFLDIYDLDGLDMYTLTCVYGVTDTASLVNVLDHRLIDWPFDFLNVLKASLNQKFQKVSFGMLNRVLKIASDPKSSKVRAEDLKNVAEVFELFELCKNSPQPISQVYLFCTLAQKLPTKRLCDALAGCFYLEGIIPLVNNPNERPDGDKQILLSIAAGNDVDRSSFDNLSQGSRQLLTELPPSTLSAIKRYTSARTANKNMNSLHFLVESAPQSPNGVELVALFVINRLKESPDFDLLNCLAIINESCQQNPFAATLKKIGQSSRPFAFKRIVNRIYSAGKIMEYSSLVALLSQMEDKKAAQPVLSLINEDRCADDLTETLQLIRNDPDCGEIVDQVAAIPAPNLTQVLRLVDEMQNRNGAEKVYNHVNGLENTKICCCLGLYNPPMDLTATSSQPSLMKSVSALTGLTQASLEKQKSGENLLFEKLKEGNPALAPFIHNIYQKSREMTPNLLAISREKSAPMKRQEKPRTVQRTPQEQEFFDIVDRYLIENPDDPLAEQIRKGEIATVDQFRRAVLSQSDPKRISLAKELQSVFQRSVPQTGLSNSKNSSLIERKTAKKLRRCLKELRQNRIEQNSAMERRSKDRNTAANKLRSNLIALLLSALNRLRSNAHQVYNETTSAQRDFQQKRNRVLNSLTTGVNGKLGVVLAKLKTLSAFRRVTLETALKKLQRLAASSTTASKIEAFRKLSRYGQLRTEAANRLSKSILSVMRSRCRAAMDVIKAESARMTLSHSHLKLISLQATFNKRKQKILRKFYDILTNKKAKLAMAAFVNKVESLPVKRKMNAFWAITAVYFREKYRDRIQGLNMVMGLFDYHRLSSLTLAMETIVKKFKKVNPWFDRILRKMLISETITDQNSLWKMRLIGRMKESAMKPSESLKIKRFAQIVARGIQKNKTFAYFKIQSHVSGLLKAVETKSK